MKNFSDEHIYDIIRELKKELPLELTFDKQNDVDILEISDSGWVYFKSIHDGEINTIRIKQLAEQLVDNNIYLVDYAVRRLLRY